MKKIVSLSLALVLVLALSSMAFAGSYIRDTYEEIKWTAADKAEIKMNIDMVNVDFWRIDYTIKLAADDSTVMRGTTGLLPSYGEGYMTYIIFPVLDASQAYYIDVDYAVYANLGGIYMQVDGYNSRTNF